FLLIGDPQITDAYSYKRTGLLQTLTEYYSDRYMGRNYRLLVNKLKPQTVFFMGDLMDGGREWDDEGWYRQTERFMRLFETSAKMQFMAGNHDIGFGDGVKTSIQERFETVFGPPSYSLPTNTTYSIVVLDTISLSSSDPAVRQKALDVLYGPLPPSPRVLMSHVPLYRPDTTWCGPYRGRQDPGTIRQGRGYQYQNLLTEELSREILERVQPIAVFSGDDHDYCEVTHTYRYGTDALEVVEMSVPTFSMAQGVPSPGVMLLDLSLGVGVKLCWLPDQISVFIGY
ncbi:Metallo-dependent phosphatase-like protein, partial [Phycomyces nitens]